jgi:DNA-binding LacI/PurR family transcriptional regulator
VLEWASGKRLKVPRDLSVGGFDDIVRASLTTPPLTTVHQPLHQRGNTAGRLLVRALDGQRVRSASLPTELVVRASTGPPRAR